MTPVELKKMIVACLREQVSLKATLAAVDECFESQHDGKPIVSGSLPLDEFIGDVEHMMKLYGNSRYTQAEEWRDKLAERLDDIMRLGGNDR